MPSPRRRVSGLMMGKGGSGCGHSTGARIGRSSSGAKCVCARRRRRSDASRRQGSLGDPCPQAGAEGTHYGRNGLRARGRAVLPFRSRFRCVERAHPVRCAVRGDAAVRRVRLRPSHCPSPKPAFAVILGCQRPSCIHYKWLNLQVYETGRMRRDGSIALRIIYR